MAHGSIDSSVVAVTREPRLEELTLDPADWESFRKLGHRAIDDITRYLSTLRERPVWMRVPESIRDSFEGALPMEGEAPERVYEEVLQKVLPFPAGNIHPRFWGWIIGTGTPVGVLAELLTATMNTPVPGFEQSAYYVERQVLEWLRELMMMPLGATGLLVSGGSAANLIGLTVARNSRAGFDVRKEGLISMSAVPMRVYASSETHSSIQKAIELLGLGSRGLVHVPVDDRYRIDLAALRAAIAADRQRGMRPICVVGNAGTTNTGAIDDLEALADLCADEKLWFHVDGAFGATAAISDRLRPLLRGMERADSLAFDLHKWAAMPYEVGGVFVRDGKAHNEAFSLHADYLNAIERGIGANGTPYADLGMQLSRGFRALKVWMSMKTYGVEMLAAVVEQNVEQARTLERLVDAHPQLEKLAPMQLNVVTFRYRRPGLSDLELDALNAELVIRLQASGIAAPSGTVVRGRTALRVASVNHRSRAEDFEILVREVVAIGDRLAANVFAPGSETSYTAGETGDAIRQR